MWALSALAVIFSLTCIVPVLGFGKERFAADVIGHQSKGNPLATSKNIDVVNPAVNVNSSTRIFVHDSSGFRPRDFTVHGNPVTMLSSRVDDNSGLLVNIGVSGKRLRERKVECYHIGLNTHVSRWSLPGILNHQKDGRLIAGKIDRGLILFSPDAQISPQLPSAGCLRVSDKHLSGKPEGNPPVFNGAQS